MADRIFTLAELLNAEAVLDANLNAIEVKVLLYQIQAEAAALESQLHDMLRVEPRVEVVMKAFPGYETWVREQHSLYWK